MAAYCCTAASASGYVLVTGKGLALHVVAMSGCCHQPLAFAPGHYQNCCRPAPDPLFVVTGNAQHAPQPQPSTHPSVHQQAVVCGTPAVTHALDHYVLLECCCWWVL